MIPVVELTKILCQVQANYRSAERIPDYCPYRRVYYQEGQSLSQRAGMPGHLQTE